MESKQDEVKKTEIKEELKVKSIRGTKDSNRIKLFGHLKRIMDEQEYLRGCKKWQSKEENTRESQT